MPSIKCRHCGREVTPDPHKTRGYINECQEGECWEKRNPPLPMPKKSPYKTIEEREGKIKREIARVTSGAQLLRRSDLTKEHRRRIELISKATRGTATQAEIEELKKLTPAKRNVEG